MNEKQLSLVPFFDRLFVERDETIEKTEHGVIIPDGDKERPNRGIVIAVGPDCKFAYASQRIIFGQHHGFELQIGNREVTVLREQDIYAGEQKPLSYQDNIDIAKRKYTPEKFKETLDDIVSDISPRERQIIEENRNYHRRIINGE